MISRRSVVVFAIHTIKNIVIAYLIYLAAIHFENWKILWFMLLVFLDSLTIQSKSSDDNKDDKQAYMTKEKGE